MCALTKPLQRFPFAQSLWKAPHHACPEMSCLARPALSQSEALSEDQGQLDDIQIRTSHVWVPLGR